MASHVAGIEQWAAGIRSRMANDPGRQDLDDHILCNGFLFLDEYLEDILLGARTDPIIELTKTPGRRKDASKKDRVATAVGVKKLHSQPPDKENIPVLQFSAAAKASSSFQKALLQASREIQQPDVGIYPSPSNRRADSNLENPFDQDLGPSVHREQDMEQVKVVVKGLITPPITRIAAVTEYERPPLLDSPSANRVTACPPGSDVGLSATSNQASITPGIELSTIAEGDENELSQASLPFSRHTGPIGHDMNISYHTLTISNDPSGPKTAVTVSYPPCDDDDDDDDTQVFPTVFDRTFNDSEPTSTASSFPIDPYARDYETHELPQVVAEHPAQPSEQHTPPSPAGPSLLRKASVPVLPSLPDPSPLRKSTHDSLVTGPVAVSSRPSAAPRTVAGTRSSWLNKARDVTAKRASVVSGVKRKSGDLSAETDYTSQLDGYVRATKIAKTNIEDEIVDAFSDKEQSHGRLPIQPFRAVLPPQGKEQLLEPLVAHAATPDDNSEEMMHILKRTVEGLGARVGKSMGKSLGGTAATAAAAEAKAAAEARLALREAKGSDASRQSRLSVSDLVGAFESGSVDKVKKRVRPDLKSPLFAPLAPLVPPKPGANVSVTLDSPTDTPHAGSQSSVSSERVTPAIPQFQVRRVLQEEPSPTLPESQPSTQSTYVSSIFDDPSAWPQSSFGTEYTNSHGFSQEKAEYEEPTLSPDHETPDLSREVGWSESQTYPTPLRTELGSSAPDQDTNVMAGPSAAQQDIIHQSPCSFTHAEQDTVLTVLTTDVPHDDAENGEDYDEFAHASIDVMEPKLKTSSTRDLSATSAQVNFVTQASTLFSKVIGSTVSNALGGSKRGKQEPLKSIQLAAVAAKKQQEEAHRKAARLKEMDKRRVAIASKKADQDATEKSKQSGDRYKRDREEATDKNTTSTKMTVKKVEEEAAKKRKVVVEIEKKPQSKKPLGKDKKDLGSSRIGKSGLNTSLSQSQLASGSVSRSFKPPGLPLSASQHGVKLIGSSQDESMPVTSLPMAGLSHTKDKMLTNGLEDLRQPSETLHAKMQVRVQAQMSQARQEKHPVPSESIELPDINSEYSDSDDENRPRTFDPPDWAQSPVLGQALQSQSRLNPDDIFGPVKPLRMEEIFKSRHSRFRARTSSANWAGTDELTTDEERDYAKRMGYV